MLALAVLLSVAAPDAMPAKTCTTVSGTYAIYVNNDFLHVDRSHHLIEVGSDALDKELEKRGWQDVVAKGQFTICSQRATSPLNWTVRDRVDLVSYRNISFVPRPGR